MINNYINNEKLKSVFDFLSKINQTAYKDVFLLSNQVLSKNPDTNDYLRRYLVGDEVRSISQFDIFNKIIKYYFFSFKNFISYIFETLGFYLSGFDFRIENSKDLIIIDTYFSIDKIIKNKKYKDRYFPGLVELLKKQDKNYAYLPEFVGIKRRFNMCKVLKILKKDNIPIVCEYRLLTYLDFLYVFYFIIFYPFHVLRLSKSLKKEKYEEKLLESELIFTLDQPTFHYFSRYLLGKRVVRSPYKKIKVISWYENQVTHKNLYKGLKTDTKKIKIYGSQLFLYPKTLLNIIPDENEIDFNIVPDKVIVNGKEFIIEGSRINFSLGPSLRYLGIFNNNSISQKNNILVLLPYYKHDAKVILKILSQVNRLEQPVLIKAHPSMDINEFKTLLSPNVILVNQDTYILFETTKILICGSTGASLEAATLGIPVIYIKNNRSIDHNFLPAYGKGIIWEEAENAEELENNIDKFNNILQNDFEEINKISNYYRGNFFNEVTEERIFQSFDL